MDPYPLLIETNTNNALMVASTVFGERHALT